jgi:subtilisin
MAKPRRYLILPAHGTQASANNASIAAGAALTEMAPRRASSLRNRLRSIVRTSEKMSGKKPKAASAHEFNVVASVNENGVKLVEATPEMIAALRFEQPGLRAVPEIFYRPAVSRAQLRVRLPKPAATVASTKKLVVTVVNAQTQAPIAGVDVVAFTNFATNTGTMGTTSSSGKVTLSVTGVTEYERLYVQHELPGLWSFLDKNVSTNGVLTVELEPLDLGTTDSLRHFHTIGGSSGSGVKVGIIDSGVDALHADLQVAGGLGCVPGSSESEFGPSGPHGTHVAGIIAGRGNSPTGMRGVAPEAEIFSYRVFDDTPSSGSNFALVKAIRRGVADGCHLLNMSLSFDHDENTGLPQVDDAVKDAIAEAHLAGVVVVAAAGNDGRKPVSFPALDDLVIAVSAVGRKGTFPGKSSESGDVVAPFGTDSKNFLAAFSNVGIELDAAGAGVGVVSTVPGGYAPMSGTSMACPAVTGVLARLLSGSPSTLAMTGSDRADAIKALLFANAQSLGLGVSNEGKGLPK